MFADYRTLLGFEWMRFRRSRRVWLGLVPPTLLFLAAVIVRYLRSDVTPEQIREQTVSNGYLLLVVPLLSYLFHGATLSEDIIKRTYPFLLTRPVPRLAIHATRFLLAFGVELLVLAVSLSALHLALYATVPAELFAAAAKTARIFGGLACTAMYFGLVCQLWSVLTPDGGGILAIMHMAADLIIGSLPAKLRFLSASFLGSEVAGLPRGGIAVTTVPTLDAWQAMLIIFFASAILFGITSVLFSNREYGGTAA